MGNKRLWTVSTNILAARWCARCAFCDFQQRACNVDVRPLRSSIMKLTVSRYGFALGLATMALMASWTFVPQDFHLEESPYHSRAFMTAYAVLPDTSNALFTGSGK